jgi:hypothetical protein
MNQKTAHLLRVFSRAMSKPRRETKRWWNRLPRTARGLARKACQTTVEEFK